MGRSEQKIIQYLNEAHASEIALVRVLQSQIAMTPSGSYRSGLEKHLEETRDHAKRVEARLGELNEGFNPFAAMTGVAESFVGQIMALTKTPFDLVRGTGGEEKILKNAKDACATEALEIATYTSLERFAKSVGDEKTAKLAASILADEQKMLDRVLREIPKLTEAVKRAEVDGETSYDVSETGAGETVRETARKATTKTKTTARKARKVPGVAQAEGQVKGAVASEKDLPIARYDKLSADEVTSKLTELSQIDLAKVDSYERKNANRATVTNRIETLRGDEPWAGYDELTAAEVTAALDSATDERVKAVRTYERAHKNRAGVLKAAERELTTA